MYRLYVEYAGSEDIQYIDDFSKDALVDFVSQKFNVPYSVASELLVENTLVYNDIFFQLEVIENE